MNLFTSFFVALLGSMLLVPPLMRMSGRLQLLDVPGARKVHNTAIPRSGGLAIVLGALIPILIWFPHNSLLIHLLVAGAVIVAFGFLDDRLDLHYGWKFFGQFVAAIIAIKGGVLIDVVPFFGIEPVHPLASHVLTFLFLLGVTNAINLSDGLDGLAGGMALLTLGAIAWLAFIADGTGVSLIALAIMGGVCGFLRYNNYPAVVFMGDAGSQFLGFMTAGLAVILTQTVNTAYNPALVLLLLGLPILDTLVVMVWRIRNGESPFSPDRNHFHHRLLDFGFLHYEAVSAIYLAQCVFVAIGLLTRYQDDLTVMSLYALCCALVLAFFRWARTSGWRRHPYDEADKPLERRNVLLRHVSWLPRASARTLEYAFGGFVLVAALAPTEVAPASGWIALVLLSIALLARWLGEELELRVRRVWIYVVAVLAIYDLEAGRAALTLPSWFLNTYVVVMVGVLVLTIRLTRREQFRTTPMDLLIVFFVIVAMLITEFSSSSLASTYKLGEAVVRLAVLFYAGELLFSKGPDHQRHQRLLVLAGLLIMVVRALLI